MGDILFKMDDYVFSYRVAGVCIQNGCVLLQKPTNDDGYAFPGGHVEFGETNAETLIREFKEEIGADVRVGNLRWVAEVFFPWGEKPCHQICLYYDVEIVDDHTPRSGVFTAQEQLEGRNFTINFYWVPLDKTEDLLIYPEQTKALLQMPADRVEHFIYKE